MRGSPSGWGARRPALALAGVLALACAGSVRLEEGRYREPLGGASVADLASLEPGWERSESAGALLAYRRVGGEGRSAWARQCRGTAAPARYEVRALLVGFEGVEVAREGPVALGGREGWSLVASAVEGMRPVHVKAVTRISAAGCTDDFLLVGGDAIEPLEPGFDRWWASFAEEPPG